MKILVTGGAGYIGSHTLIELYAAGHTAVVVDNLSNSNPISLQRVAEIIGVKEIPFYKVDIRDKAGLDYYDNNITGTLVLVEVMRNHGCKNIIFSSSATVYGDPAEIPITEDCPKGVCTNPYGWTKSMLERGRYSS